ncbi:MAG: helix-turn-helix domain-containing protein [Ruminococcaceae bacterium]|nr:helix-turn-helix domain-containing protein [Oscillospiraceae bacterium]
MKGCASLRHFPYTPAKPLPALFYNANNFLEKYHFNINRVSKNIVNRPHYHDFFQLYYVLSGSYKDTINRKDVICDSRSVTLTMPYTTHALNTTAEVSEDPEVLSLSFHADDFHKKGIPFTFLTFNSAAYENKILPTHLHIYDEDKPLADKLMMEIHSEYQKKSGMFLTKVFENLNLFLSLCAKASSEVVSSRFIAAASARGKTITNTIKKIKQDCSKKWLIDDAAKASMMSRSTFTKNFREVTGMSYHEVVTQIRLMKSVELMRYTRKSIAEIAEEVGFSSNAHFTKECIKMFTLPPQQLRFRMAEITRLRQEEIKKWDIETAWSDNRSSELVLEHFNNSIGKKV